jgi:hypothetical protein
MMIKFYEFISKKFNEIAEPMKTSAKRRIITKNSGTIRATKVIEYQFKTSLGNQVKIHFQKKEDDPLTYDVSFYVNDTQYDDASKTNESERDPEVLRKVLYLVKQKADALKAQEIHFVAQKGEGDIKVIKNLNIENYKPNAFIQLNLFKKWLKEYKVKMIEPNRELYLKLNRPTPPARPDIDKKKWLQIIEKFELLIFSGNNLNINDLEELIYNKNIFNEYPQHEKLVKSLIDYKNAFVSNTDLGFLREKNRRASLYSKLTDRFFSDWIVSKKNDYFIMKRKD